MLQQQEQDFKINHSEIFIWHSSIDKIKLGFRIYYMNENQLKIVQYHLEVYVIVVIQVMPMLSECPTPENVEWIHELLSSMQFDTWFLSYVYQLK